MTVTLSESARSLKVLVVGNGAREHAIAWKLGQSPLMGLLLVAPGNAGTAQIGVNVPIEADDLKGLVEFATTQGIDFTVIGPEVPLAAGIVDRFEEAGLAAFGPTQAAARIESSKGFAKRLMREYSVPTGKADIFADYDSARRCIEDSTVPIVIKADGLAAGKGVVVARTREAALEALHRLMVQREFWPAGDQVIVEEYLEGHEISVFAFVDGERLSPMLAARDYKTVGDGDTGPNTGGMGAYSPPGDWNGDMERNIRRTIMEPVVRALRDQGNPYRGVLYAGLMITDDGPKVLEFNCRLGDPEAQAVLPRLKTDLLNVMIRAAEGDLGAVSLEWDERPCVAVVVASGGYPGKYATGLPIEGLRESAPDLNVFHAGTVVAPADGASRVVTTARRVVTTGGRVLTVTSLGSDLEDARRKAYAGAANVGFEDSFYRKDIALFA